MAETSLIKSKLEDILGPERLNDIAILESDEDKTGETVETLTNAKEISCDCKTLILRPKHAKLILPSLSMIQVEKVLNLQHSDKMFKNLVKSCYWLVDDMYKFEQISYTKEVNTQIQSTSPQEGSSTQGDSINDSSEQTGPATIASKLPGLRFLACAECNKCPLGWFDPGTKESYLYVW